MSSGEKAKPPKTYEERNPFDISRRSQKEIAAEIAQRMAAWKLARGRSYATPSTVPGAEAKLPPISAPVQPARLPKFGEHARAPQYSTPPELPSESSAESSPGSSWAETPQMASAPAKPARADQRAPLFATSSAMRRAMPPAPSLKRPVAAVEPAVATPKVEAPIDEPLSAETAAPATAAAREIAAPVASASDVPENEGDGPGWREVDASAFDISAAPLPEAEFAAHAALEMTAPDREAHGTDAPESDAPTFEAPAIDTPAIDSPAAEIPESTPATYETPEITLSDSEPQRGETLEIDVPEIETPEVEALGIDTAGAEAGEPERLWLDALASKAHDIRSPWMTGREEDALLIAMAITDAHESEPTTQSIEANSAEADRLEEPEVDAPRIDPPIEEPAPPAMAIEAREIEAPIIATPTETSQEIKLDAPGTPDIETSYIDEGERREPTFDRPIVNKREIEAAVPTAAPDEVARGGARRIAPPSIETRIEARRFETLRADPRMAARPAIFPRIDPEEWDVPPAVAARANPQRRGGTGWAIGLGAVLLIIGITAPAALWQQGYRQASTDQASTDQDQVAILTPPPSVPEPKPAAQPENPQPDALQPSATPAAQVPSAPTPPAQPQPDQPVREEQTSLSAVRDGGELNEAPISTPPAPVLASEPATPVTQTAAGEAPAFPPVARPFVPDAEPATPAPFLRAPAGAAAVVDGAEPFFGAAPSGTAPASIALKPGLMAQLKPKAVSAPTAKPAASAPQKVVRKPQKTQFPQTLDRMFDDLIDTLSNGQPTNPANKPTPPSTRK